MSDQHVVQFQYRGKIKEQVPKDVLVTEDYITKKLEPCFEQKKINVKEVVVTFELEPQNSGTYICEISIVSPDVSYTVKESGKNYGAVVNTAIDKTIAYIHKHKEKLSEFNS